MAYGEFYVQKEGWARWPKVLIMCRKRGRDDSGEYLVERRCYVPEGTLEERDALLRDMWRELDMLDSGLETVPMMRKGIRLGRIRERYEALGLGE